MNTAVIAQLPMYPAPAVVGAAYEQWLTQTLRMLEVEPPSHWNGSLQELWLHPRLLLAQTCGFPLVTQLKRQVRVVGRPRFDLPDARDGQHCSVLIVNANDPRQSLQDLWGCRGAYNSKDSNSGFNLLLHALAPHARDGRFFRAAQETGSHRESIAQVARQEADLAAIDSVTFAYLARHAPEEVAGVRILASTAASPTLPYITSLAGPAPALLREAMNAALTLLPEVARALAIVEVQEVEMNDYEVLLGYRRASRSVDILAR